VQRKVFLDVTNKISMKMQKNLDNGNDFPENHLFVFGLGNIGRTLVEMTVDENKKIKHKYKDRSGLHFSPKIHFKSMCGTIYDDSPSSSGSEKDSGHKLVEKISFHNYSEIQSRLRNATHVLITIPIIKSLGSDSSMYHDILLTQTTTALYKSIKKGTWVGYLSTTGVYGDYDGEWVHETNTARAIKTLKSNIIQTKAQGYAYAELRWTILAKEYGWNLCIFRCAALYGNNLSAIHTILKKQNMKNIKFGNDLANIDAVKNIDVKEGRYETTNMKEIYTSRIHIVDVSRAILASMAHSNSNKNTSKNHIELYNLADDEPRSRSIVMKYAAKLLEKENTTEIVLDNQLETPLNKRSATVISERSKRRMKENKRIRNSKMHRELLRPYGGLMYPTYKEGLAAILKYLKQQCNTQR